MADNNYLIESDALAFPAIEAAIQRLLLDGLDVRITPVSRNKALVPRHVLDAIRLQYNIEPWDYLRFQGLTFNSAYPISDQEAMALVMHRSAAELDVRPLTVVPTVAGVAWHLDNIRAPVAWGLMGGPDTIPWACKVGQIDTGYTRHPALGFTAGGGASPWLLEAECRNFFMPPDPQSEPGDPSGEDPRSGLFWGHGTRIGATISGWAPGGDAGADFYGCAPRVPHVVVRISNTVAINDQLPAFTQALNYLVDVARVDVVNLSMGMLGGAFTARTKAALNHAYDQGVILVCAGGQYVSGVIKPASYRRTVAVGGSTSKDQVWAKASRGPEIDWAAPAADIRRASIDKKTGPFVYGNGGDGTSYATALSSGVAAMWLTHRATEIAAMYGKTWKRVWAFKKISADTARKPAVWGPGVAGSGILDAAAVLNANLPPANAQDYERAV